MRWQGLIGVGLLIVSGIASGQKVRGMGRVMAFGNTTPIDIELPDVGQDMEVDPVRQLLYVSVPTRNEIVVISLNSLTIVDLLFVGNRPHGIDLSADGRTLYAALHQATSVAYLDLESGLVSDTIVLGDLLGHSTTGGAAPRQRGGAHGRRRMALDRDARDRHRQRDEEVSLDRSHAP